MFATIRRYDGVDQNRSVELTRKVNETLVPKLETILPNEPKITSGKIVAHSDRVLVAA